MKSFCYVEFIESRSVANSPFKYTIYVVVVGLTMVYLFIYFFKIKKIELWWLWVFVVNGCGCMR